MDMEQKLSTSLEDIIKSQRSTGRGGRRNQRGGGPGRNQQREKSGQSGIPPRSARFPRRGRGGRGSNSVNRGRGGRPIPIDTEMLDVSLANRISFQKRKRNMLAPRRADRLIGKQNNLALTMGRGPARLHPRRNANITAAAILRNNMSLFRQQKRQDGLTSSLRAMQRNTLVNNSRQRFPVSRRNAGFPIGGSRKGMNQIATGGRPFNQLANGRRNFGSPRTEMSRNQMSRNQMSRTEISRNEMSRNQISRNQMSRSGALIQSANFRNRRPSSDRRQSTDHRSNRVSQNGAYNNSISDGPIRFSHRDSIPSPSKPSVNQIRIVAELDNVPSPSLAQRRARESRPLYNAKTNYPTQSNAKFQSLSDRFS